MYNEYCKYNSYDKVDNIMFNYKIS